MNDKNIFKKSMTISKYQYWILGVVSFFCMFVFSIYTVMISSYKSNEIEKAKKLYGCYHIMVENVPEIYIDSLTNGDNVESFLLIYRFANSSIGDNQVIVNATDSKDMTKCGLELLSGREPQSESEIAIEYKHAFQLGYNEESVLGKELDVDINGNTYTFNVTGVINKLISTVDDSTPNIYVDMSFLDNENWDLSNIYVQCKDSSKYMEDVEYIRSEYNLYVYSNYELLYAEGNTTDAKYNMTKENWFVFIIIIIVIAFIYITINNIIDFFIIKSNEILNIHKIIGTPCSKLINNILKNILLYSAVGILFGILMGVFVISIINYMSSGILLDGVDAKIVIPYKMHVIVITGIILYISFLVYIKLYPIKKLTASQMNEFINKKYNEKARTNNLRTIFKNRRFSLLKLSFRNIVYFYNRKIVISIFISISIIILLVFGIQVSNKNESNEYNTNFRYYFEVLNEFDADEEESEDINDKGDKIKEICDSNNVLQYVYANFINKTKIEKNWLSDSYKNYLLHTAEGKSALNRNNDYFKMDIAIMGYSKTMIKSLYESGDISVNNLKDNECIMLTKNVDSNNRGTYELTPQLGYLLNADSIEGNTEFKIVDTIDDLPVYPLTNDSCLCIIVNYETFQRYYMHNHTYTYSFYINTDNDNIISQINKVIKGTNAYTVTDQQISNKELMYNQMQTVVFYTVVFALIIISSFINLILISRYEINLRIKEYAMIKSVGINSKIVLIICTIENCFTYLVGIIIGIGCSKLVINVMKERLIINIDKIPTNLLIMCILFITISFAIINTISWRRISAVRLPDDLLD